MGRPRVRHLKEVARHDGVRNHGLLTSHTRGTCAVCTPVVRVDPENHDLPW